MQTNRAARRWTISILWMSFLKCGFQTNMFYSVLFCSSLLCSVLSVRPVSSRSVIVFYPILSYPILSYPVLSCPISHTLLNRPYQHTAKYAHFQYRTLPNTAHPVQHLTLSKTAQCGTLCDIEQMCYVVLGRSLNLPA